MVVSGYEKLESFWNRHARARSPLLRWYQATSRARWKNPAEIKQTFRSADVVCDCVVFNIHGNDYRLISKINFVAELVDIRAVLTHKDYDRGGWKDDCNC